MTQEEKLLFRDLCARLPYDVNILWEKTKGITLVGILLGITTIGAEMDNSALRKIPFDKLKPYLRPMSSMTEEEKNILLINVDLLQWDQLVVSLLW